MRFDMTALGARDYVVRACLSTEYRISSANILVEGGGLSSLQVPVTPIGDEAGWQYLSFSVFGTEWSVGRGPVWLTVNIATVTKQYVQTERYVISEVVDDLRLEEARNGSRSSRPTCIGSTAATSGKAYKQVGIKL
jgi:hypothetical protein